MKKISCSILLIIFLAGCSNQLPLKDFSKEWLNQLIYAKKEKDLSRNMHSEKDFFKEAQDLKKQIILEELLSTVGYQLDYTDKEADQLFDCLQETIVKVTTFEVKEVTEMETEQKITYKIAGLDYEGFLQAYQKNTYQRLKDYPNLSEDEAKKIVMEELEKTLEQANKVEQGKEQTVRFTKEKDSWTLSDKEATLKKIYQLIYFNHETND